MKFDIRKVFYSKNYIVITGLFIIIFSLIYLIGFDGFGTPISYFLYLLMSYSLVVICIKVYTIVKIKFDKFISNNKYLSKYKDDYKLRYRISLFSSLVCNILYVLFKLITGIAFKSIWFISFAFYYLLLTILRTNIGEYEIHQKSTLKDEYKKYRNTGVILLFTIVILTMIILIIVNQKIMNIYPTWIAISVALYTFYLIFNSIHNLIKYRNFKSPLITSAKIINVITSLVSLISLEVVLIPTFGIDQEIFFEITIIATGGGIAIIIIVKSMYMIIKSTEWLNNND